MPDRHQSGHLSVRAFGVVLYAVFSVRFGALGGKVGQCCIWASIVYARREEVTHGGSALKAQESRLEDCPVQDPADEDARDVSNEYRG